MSKGRSVGGVARTRAHGRMRVLGTAGEPIDLTYRIGVMEARAMDGAVNHHNVGRGRPL